eukprot:COSAG04_NODE_6596_length_1297_cov_1.161102_2_plen_176_part_00
MEISSTCDGISTYQLSDGDAVLYRNSGSWYIGPSSALADCGTADAFLRSGSAGEAQGPSHPDYAGWSGLDCYDGESCRRRYRPAVKGVRRRRGYVTSSTFAENDQGLFLTACTVGDCTWGAVEGVRRSVPLPTSLLFLPHPCMCGGRTFPSRRSPAPDDRDPSDHALVSCGVFVL